MATDRHNHKPLTAEQESLVLRYSDRALNKRDESEALRLLATNVEAKQLLDQLEAGMLPFEAAVKSMLGEQVSEQTRNLVENHPAPRQRQQRRYGILSGAVAACLLAGLGLFSLISERGSGLSPDHWISQVANYQQLYVRQTVEMADETNRQTLDHLLQSQLGRQLIVPNLEDQSVTFRRGQLLQVNGQPLIQLAYLPKSGLPIALCIMPTRLVGPGSAVELNYGESHGLRNSNWSDGDLHFLMIGDVSQETLAGLTTLARGQL